MRILDKELGVPPLEETSRLFQEIKEQTGISAATHQKPVQSPPAAPGDPRQQTEVGLYLSEATAPIPARRAHALHLPLTNRDIEWNAMQQVYAEIERDGRFVVLEEEAGDWEDAPWPRNSCLHTPERSKHHPRARCYPGETNLAYAPFIEGLSSAIHQPVRADWHHTLNRLIPERSCPPVARHPPAAPGPACRAARRRPRRPGSFF